MSDYLEVIVEFMTAEQSGRKRSLQLQGYRPHFRVSPDSEMLGVEFMDGPDIVQPGKKISATVKLLFTPEVSYEALEVGTAFEILEGPYTVGHGTVIRC